MDVRIGPSSLKGSIFAQPSKSDAHRKIITAAFSDGISRIDNVVLSEDIRATMRGLESAGCFFQTECSKRYASRMLVEVKGIDGMPIPPSERIVDCGESGSTLRFLSMIFACLGGITVFNGKGRLPLRSMKAAVEIFEKYGVKAEYPGGGTYLPMKITGKLKGENFKIDTSVTSQLLSGLIMGMALNGRNAVIEIEGANESAGYVGMTLNVLREAGCRITYDKNYSIKANGIIRAGDYEVEGDWSNASYFIAMKKLGADIEVEGLPAESAQPDRAAPELLSKIMADGAAIDVSGCPDLMPALATTAASTPGVKKITGGKRLREKESDRIHSVAEGLKAIGAKCEEKDDGLVITGGEIAGGAIRAFNDHRIAMAFSSLCVAAKGDIVIRGAECVKKSYPSFFEDLKKIGGDVG